MSEYAGNKINIIELLMGIKEDVSSIKTDMANFKETQNKERDSIYKDLDGMRAEYKRAVSDVEVKIRDTEARLSTKITSIQSVQNNLCGEVDTLKHAEEKKDAKKWRTVMAFIGTAVGGMLFAKLPDFITFLIQLKTLGGK